MAAAADDSKAPGSKAVEFLKDILSKNKLPSDVNIKIPAYHNMVFKLADLILGSKMEIGDFEAAVSNPSDDLIGCLNLPKDNEYATKYNGTLVNALLIAKGKTLFEKAKTQQKSIHVTVIVPMYGEQNRIRPFDAKNNPLGQDFLNQKVKQLKWLFDGSDDNYTWNIICIDDGCPNKSGEIATKLIETEKLGDLVCVRRLQEVIDKTLQVDEGKVDDYKDDLSVKYFGDMKSTKDSRKGGAVGYALYVAKKDFAPKNKDTKHVIVATDSDLSMDLCYIGGLLNDMTANDKLVASVGARYGTAGSYIAYPDGLVIDHKTYLGPNRCRIVMRHCLRKYLLPALESIYDTQVGLKAFDSKIIDKLVSTVKDRGSSFDMEILLTIENAYGHGVVSTYPTYFVEDFESSNFTSGDNPGSYYYPQCFAIIGMYESFVKPFDPIKADSNEDLQKERQKAYDYIKNVKPEHFEEMCKKLEKDVMPTDAFLTHKLTMDDIINATPNK